MPPLYPNIVTLNSGVEIFEQIDHLDSRLPVGWGIKDSFKTLQLAERGFTIAFNAHWYCRPPREHQANKHEESSSVKVVTGEAELESWGNAWGEQTGLFRAPLISGEDVELFYVEEGGRVASGLATNLSGNSVGISNAFGRPNGILACIAEIADKHPARGIVGYGDKTELASLSTIGFQEVGELQIWLKNGR